MSGDTVGETARDVRAEVELDVVRAQAGDRASFDRLAASHKELVYRTAYHVLRDVEDALDATQEALLKAYRHLGTFDRRTTFGGWVRTIAANCALDRLARRKRDRAHGAALPEDEVVADARQEHVGERLERNETRAAVRQAIEALPPAQRSAVLLRDVEGLSYEEIARTLGIAKGTVMSRIFYGRENLKRTLGASLAAREAGR